MSSQWVIKQWDALFQDDENGKDARYPRQYKHFDRPIGHKKATKIVTSPESVASHGFLPFLFYEKEIRRYRGKGANAQPKKRPLMYAAHKDGCIFAYYTLLLTEPYEDRLKALGIADSVIAYRKSLGNNVSFAHEAFEEIKKRGSCAAIAIDIKSFFDNIDHAALKEEWCKILGTKKLPSDHFAVFKAVTSWAKVDRDACYEALGLNPKKVEHPICTPSDYRDKIRGAGLVERNPQAHGIPQGSPISAFLANLYMLPFDCEMRKLADQIGGYYRRYSDDILWVCDEQKIKDVLDAVDASLKKRGSTLERSKEKTEISVFSLQPEGRMTCYTIDDGDKKNYQKPFQYLGFTFDGRRKLVRSSTLSKFHRRLIYAVRGAKRAARKQRHAQVFRRKLNQKFTHLGKRNFITTYIKNAYRLMEDRALKKQVSGNYERVTKEINKKGRRR